ncbi:MAG: SRPBCC family protein [Gemmatimonadetes bacterium]|nr:SRPBCC family protein [Gemmatimonadota bacterium]
MSLVIHEAFTVQASPDRVFAFLNNPADVVTCLPGAELTESIDARTHVGRVRVKVGPVSTAYAGRAVLTEVDPALRRVTITGEGKESGGSGSARLHMVAVATATADGSTSVTVDATIDIAGRIMQFGRGLIESVSKQLFQQFVVAAREKLERAPETAVLATPTTVTGPSAPPAVEAPRELRLLPLLWRSLVDWIKRLLGRS